MSNVEFSASLPSRSRSDFAASKNRCHRPTIVGPVFSPARFSNRIMLLRMLLILILNLRWLFRLRSDYEQEQEQEQERRSRRMRGALIQRRCTPAEPSGLIV